VSRSAVFALSSALFLIASPLHAQRVMGTVTHATGGGPVAGALVSAYNDRGDSIPVTLSNATGRFLIHIPVGRTFTLFVRSIGLQAVRMPVGPLAAGQDSTVQISMSRIVWTLQTVNIEAITLCDRKDVGTDRVAQLWIEVTNALESSRQTNRIVRRNFDWMLFNNEINARSGSQNGTSREGTALTARPFHAATARELYNNGYVIPERTAMLFKAPDEAVLVDDRFLEAHCFWVSTVDVDGVKHHALNFVPVDALRVNDIAGTFLVDANSYELRSLKFSYTRILGADARRKRTELYDLGAPAPPPVQREQLNPGIDPSMAVPGGEIRFKRLLDGTMIIDKWKLWVTDNWIRTDPAGLPLPMPNVIREAGGEILRIGG
jgi:hypothetical protein